jgi:predicted patatin/cPLA2 family phospholipase
MNDKLKQWLFNLNCLFNNIENSSTSYRELYTHFDKLGVNLMYDIDAVFMAYILTFTNSFIDEWNLNIELNTPIRKICKPAFKFINSKWPEIKTLRNNILAHNHRDKNKNSIHFTEKGFNYKVPVDLIEIELLVSLFKLIIDAVNHLYSFNYEDVSNKITSLEIHFNAMSVDETNKIKVDIINQMNELLNKHFNHIG